MKIVETGQTKLNIQYHLEIENYYYYYIDLLFYNLKVRSYVVIELKPTEFKPEYAGKLNFYLSAVDKYIKDENDNPTFEYCFVTIRKE